MFPSRTFVFDHPPLPWHNFSQEENNQRENNISYEKWVKCMTKHTYISIFAPQISASSRTLYCVSSSRSLFKWFVRKCLGLIQKLFFSLLVWIGNFWYILMEPWNDHLSSITEGLESPLPGIYSLKYIDCVGASILRHLEKRQVITHYVISVQESPCHTQTDRLTFLHKYPLSPTHRHTHTRTHANTHTHTHTYAYINAVTIYISHTLRHLVSESLWINEQNLIV